MLLTTTNFRFRDHLKSRILSVPRFSALLGNRRRLRTEATGKPFRILFLGRDEFSSLVLRELHQAKDVWNEIVCVTQPEAPGMTSNSSKRSASSPLSALARELGLPTHHIPLKRRDFRKYTFPGPFGTSDSGSLNSLSSDYVLVTASFGRILTDAHLSLFQPGRRLNVHPSLLPKYRGPAPIQHAILNNDQETGVCVIEMTKKSDGIDAGELWGLQQMAMPPMPDFPSLRDKLAQMGGQLLVSTLRAMIQDKVTSTLQPTSGDCTPAPLIKSDHAHLDFSTMTAGEIFRLYRAISHQKALTTSYRLPSSFNALSIFSMNTPSVQQWQSIQFTQLELPFDATPITKDFPLPATRFPLHALPGSYAFSKSTNSIYVRCAGESVLTVKRLKPAGGKEMDAQAFWNGVWTTVVREKKKRAKQGLKEDTGNKIDGSEEGLWMLGGSDASSSTL